MLTALSMEGASRVAAGNGSEHMEQRETAPQACESWERRDIQETETRTDRYQHPASTAHAQRDWTGCNPASRHTHRHVHLSDLAGMYPDPPPRDARGVKTKQETKSRQGRQHIIISKRARGSRKRPPTSARTRCEEHSERTGYELEHHRRRSGQWGMGDIDEESRDEDYVDKESHTVSKRPNGDTSGLRPRYLTIPNHRPSHFATMQKRK